DGKPGDKSNRQACTVDDVLHHLQNLGGIDHRNRWEVLDDSRLKRSDCSGSHTDGTEVERGDSVERSGRQHELAVIAEADAIGAANVGDTRTNRSVGLQDR